MTRSEISEMHRVARKIEASRKIAINRRALSRARFEARKVA